MPFGARIGLMLLVVLAGCGGVGTEGSTGGYVSGDHTISVVAAANRKPAPELNGLDLAGRRLEAAQLRGRSGVLVVNVWGSWCAECRREAPDLVRVAAKYAKKDVRFLGLLSRDKPAAALAFVRTFNVRYPSLQDTGGRLQLGFADSLPSQAIPTTWVIDRRGRVAARVLGVVSEATLSDLIDDALAEKAAS